MWRGIFGASEYLKQYVRGQGYSGDRFDHLELTKFLRTEDDLRTDEGESKAIAFPEGVTVKPLDLQRDDLVKVYDVLKMAYICGVAAKARHRAQGIALNLFRLSFENAGKATNLEKMTLGTNRFNASAVRAYLTAGMVETASVNPGRIVAKDIQRCSPQKWRNEARQDVKGSHLILQYMDQNNQNNRM